jgi:hypothetical protein
MSVRLIESARAGKGGAESGGVTESDVNVCHRYDEGLECARAILND